MEERGIKGSERVERVPDENAEATRERPGRSFARWENLLRSIKLLNVVIDTLLFIACWELFYRGGTNVQKSLLLCAFYALSYTWLGRVYNGFHIDVLRISETAYSLTLASVLSAGMVYVGMTLVRLQWANPLPLIGLVVVQGLWNLLWGWSANRIYFRVRPRGRMIVIYREESDLIKLQEMRNLGARYEVGRYVKGPAGLEELKRAMEGYDAAFLAGIPATLRNGAIKHCIERDMEVYAIPHIGDVIMAGARHMRMYNVPVMRATRARPVPEYLLVKRCADVVLSLMALVVLSPVMLGAALAIKLCDGGPVLYKQTRLTKDGKEFEIWKFRSMVADAEGDGIARLAREGDERITPVGRVIRACRIDELPQLINIVRGEMSLVGPRPERPEIAAQYEEEIPAFGLRLQVKAGLTGLAQVYGRYNTTPYDKLQMDLMYINEMSILEDVRLMFATLKVLLQRESTSGVEGESTTALGRVVKESIRGGAFGEEVSRLAEALARAFGVGAIAEGRWL